MTFLRFPFEVIFVQLLIQQLRRYWDKLNRKLSYFVSVANLQQRKEGRKKRKIRYCVNHLLISQQVPQTSMNSRKKKRNKTVFELIQIHCLLIIYNLTYHIILYYTQHFSDLARRWGANASRRILSVLQHVPGYLSHQSTWWSTIDMGDMANVLGGWAWAAPAGAVEYVWPPRALLQVPDCGI